jgi:hypothetical protein
MDFFLQMTSSPGAAWVVAVHPLPDGEFDFRCIQTRRQGSADE